MATPLTMGSIWRRAGVGEFCKTNSTPARAAMSSKVIGWVCGAAAAWEIHTTATTAAANVPAKKDSGLAYGTSRLYTLPKAFSQFWDGSLSEGGAQCKRLLFVFLERCSFCRRLGRRR